MNVTLIKKWIEENGPNGMSKLAGRAEISTGTLHKILNRGHEPGFDIVKKIATVMEVTLDSLGENSGEDQIA